MVFAAAGAATGGVPLDGLRPFVSLLRVILEFAQLPERLVSAHAEGRLVLFVGAGASADSPSDLPLFGELATRVADVAGAPPGDVEHDAPEVLLEAIAGSGIEVHAIVHRIISESTEPNATHEAVAAIAVAGQVIRLVTTNYDRHLSACLPKEASIYEAPNLPTEVDFAGVVHLHGSVGQTADRLVITTTDFARSYIKQPSRTLVFLQQLFASQAVLFIGYSIRDTLMQYVLRAKNPGAELYTLTDKPEDPLWETLGVTAVGYTSREHLPAVLTEWAQLAGASFEEHDRRVARILSREDIDGGLCPQDESYLSRIVSDPELVRIFTERARGPVWLRWAASRPDSKLFSPGAELGPVDEALLFWFVWHHNDDDQSTAETIRLIIEHGGRLHEVAWANMVMAPNPRGGAGWEAANRLLLVLADAIPPGLGFRALRWLEACESPRDDDLFVELVDRLSAPRLVSPEAVWVSMGLRGPFEATGQDPSVDVYGRGPHKDFWSRRRDLAADLLSVVDGHLRRVHRIEAISGNPDPYDSRSAIERHPQNRGARGVDFLVDAARDLWEILLADLPETAVGYLQAWAASPWAVLNRLAIHGWGHRTDTSADEKLAWLLTQDGWTRDNRLHHETMQLIAETVPHACEGSIEKLIGQITAETEPAGQPIVFNKLGWIAVHAPESPAAQGAFADANAANPELAMSEHPDFLTWVGNISAGPLPIGHIDGTSPQDLVDSLQTDPTAATAALLRLADCITPRHPMPFNWMQALKTVHDATEISPAAGIALLEALIEDPATEPEASRSLASAVLMELRTSLKRQRHVAEHRDEIGPRLEALWDVGVAHWPVTPDDPSDLGWLFQADNSWPGQVTRLALQRIDAQGRADPDAWIGLGDSDRHFLERITAGDTHEAHLGQVVLAHRTFGLYAADPAWATTHVLPLLDPQRDPQRAVRCWDGYLYDAAWSPQLLDTGLLGHFLAFAAHAHNCCRDAQHGFANLAAGLCLHSDMASTDSTPSPLTRFTAGAEISTRAAFIAAVAHALLDADTKTTTAQWHRWMHDYWSDRLSSIPRQLAPDEASALVSWAILQEEDFPAAANLVLKFPTSLEGTSILGSATAQLEGGTGPLVSIVDRHPGQVTRVVAHLLEHTDPQTAQRWDISMRELIPLLRDRTNESTFTPLREQLVRLGWISRILGVDS